MSAPTAPSGARLDTLFLVTYNFLLRQTRRRRKNTTEPQYGFTPKQPSRPLCHRDVDVDTVTGRLNELLPKVRSKLVPQSNPKMTTILYSNKVIFPPFPPLGEGGEGGRGGPNFVVTLSSKHITKCNRPYFSDFLPPCGYQEHALSRT